MYRTMLITATLLSVTCTFPPEHILALPPDNDQGVGAAANGTLPLGVVRRLGSAIFRHERIVDGLTFTVDGKQLLSIGGPNVEIWDVASGKHQGIIHAASSQLRTLALSPDGKTLVAAGSPGVLQFWNMPAGTVRDTIDKWGNINELHFSRDGKYLAALQDKGVQLLDSATGKLLHKIGEGERWFTASFSPDGRKLVLAGMKEFQIWDTVTGKQLPTWKKQTGQCPQVGYSSDGNLLIVVQFGKIQVWDVKQQEIINYLAKGKPWFHRFALSSDGKLLAGYSGDHEIHIWDLQTGVKLRICEGEFAYCHDLAFSPDGKFLAAGNNHEVVICDVATGKRLHPAAGHSRAIGSVSVSPNGATTVSGGLDGIVIAWDHVTGKEKFRFQLPGSPPTPVGPIVHSPNGKWLGVGTDSGTNSNTVWLVDAQTGKGVRQFAKGMWPIRGLAFSPNSDVILASDSNFGVRRWEVGTGKELEPLLKMDKFVNALHFSPDGTRLIAGSHAYQISILDAVQGKLLSTFCPAPVSLSEIAMVPYSSLFITGGYDKSFRVIDAITGKVMHTVATPANLLTLAVSRDGRFLVTSGLDKKIQLWEVATRQSIRQVSGHKGFVRALDFSLDGKNLISGGDDSALLVWAMDQLLFGEELPQVEGTDPELQQWWDVMGQTDPAKAYPALVRLTLVPDRAVPFLAKFLRPPPQVPDVAGWVKQLDDDQFAVRQKASQELERLGPFFLPQLQKHLDQQQSPEVQKRLEQVLAKIESKMLPYDRAFLILERAGTPLARELLGDIAKAFPGSPGGNRAKQALQRLGG